MSERYYKGLELSWEKVRQILKREKNPYQLTNPYRSIDNKKAGQALPIKFYPQYLQVIREALKQIAQERGLNPDGLLEQLPQTAKGDLTPAADDLESFKNNPIDRKK